MGKLMKRAITTFTAVLLTTLTIIRLLPILISPDTLVATYGLRHLNFLPPSAESNNSCAEPVAWTNSTATGWTKPTLLNTTDTAWANDTGSNTTMLNNPAPCTMYLSFATFSAYWYPVLMALGIYCLLDAISTQCCKDKETNRIRWPTPYRLAENIVKGEVGKAKKEEEDAEESV